MNTIENFLQELLNSQNLTPEQERTLQTHKAEIAAFLQAEFGDAPLVRYAGSHAKGTMIRDNYDLDIVCYFPSSDNRTLKEIREDVSNHLGQKYVLEPKASAERIKNLKGASAPAGYHIDVVPGQVIEGTKDVFIHVAYGEKERMKTNLKTHIDHIVNSECVPVIRLVKIWAHRNNVHIKTFILELFVVETLSGSKNKSSLQESFLKVMETLKDKFGNLQLVDPANTNNVVSRTVSESDKTMTASAAEASFEKIDGSDNIVDWKNVFGEQNNGGYGSSGPTSTGPVVINNPPGQWAQ